MNGLVLQPVLQAAAWGFVFADYPSAIKVWEFVGNKVWQRRTLVALFGEDIILACEAVGILKSGRAPSEDGETAHLVRDGHPKNLYREYRIKVAQVEEPPPPWDMAIVQSG
jgi:hypothetical protein